MDVEGAANDGAAGEDADAAMAEAKAAKPSCHSSSSSRSSRRSSSSSSRSSSSIKPKTVEPEPEPGKEADVTALIIQGPLLGYLLLDPRGSCVRVEAKGIPCLRKLAEFRSNAIRQGPVPLAIGVSQELRPQGRIVDEVCEVLRQHGEIVPSEAELIQAGWWDAIVGVLHIRGAVRKGSVGWKALGRWGKDTGKWCVGNLVDSKRSYALGTPITQWTENGKRPCGPWAKIKASVVRALQL